MKIHVLCIDLYMYKKPYEINNTYIREQYKVHITILLLNINKDPNHALQYYTFNNILQTVCKLHIIKHIINTYIFLSNDAYFSL